MIIRVRTQLGSWRVNDVQPQDTFETLRNRVEAEHHADLGGNPFSLDPQGSQPISDSKTVKQAGLQNGTMIYTSVDECKTSIHEHAHMAKTITKDGTIVPKPYDATAAATGFRPGMLPLRSMKMQWTLTDFVALDSKFEFKVQRQETCGCKAVQLEGKCVQEFQDYMRTFDYRRIRIAFIYGKVKADKSLQMEFMYEPAQETTDTHFELLDNENEQARVEEIAKLLGFQRIGVLIAHPPRVKNFYFSGHELLLAAELQLESTGGVTDGDVPFAALHMTQDRENMNNVAVEAFQISRQCMEMVAESVLAPSHNLGRCAVNPTYTVIMEGKPTSEVDNAFFLVPIAVEKHETVLFVSEFPRANRTTSSSILSQPSPEALKAQVLSAGKGGWTLLDKLSDFQLLLFLSNFMDMSDVAEICKSVVQRDIPLGEGYQLIIRSMAGIEM